MLNEIYRNTLEKITKPGMYDIYPVWSDRGAWDSIDGDLKSHIIDEAKPYIGYEWPRFQASDYMEYYEAGSRKSWDRVFKSVFDPLTKLTMAECAEGKGRFLKDIANGIWARCEDTSWVHTGHLSHHGDEQVPLHDSDYLDLRACSTGSQLAHIYYLLKPQLDNISPHICNRLEHEISRRIIDNYINNNHWWTNLEPGGTINNWNTHCNKNVIRTALIMEKDPQKLKAVMEKATRSLDVFLSIHAQDGACDEGPGYWKGAGFSYLTILSFLAEIYGQDVKGFLDDRIRNMGSYIYKVLISDDYYMSYADGNGRNPMFDIKLYKTARNIGDPALTQLAADTFRVHQEQGEYYDYFIYILFDYLEYAMGFEEMSKIRKPADFKRYYLRDAALEDAHISASRQDRGTSKGFFTGIKGGHNDESHNHNDIGVFYLYYDGLPVVIDAGAGVYTIKTFSPDRYDIWTMQSQWHSLPLINGLGQAAGRKYASKEFMHEDTGDMTKASLDITPAYPMSIGLEAYSRTYTMDRDNETVSLSDHMELKRISSRIEWYLTLAYEPVVIGRGKIMLSNGTSQVMMEFDGDYTVWIEDKDISGDAKLSGSWGDTIYRLCLKANEEKTIHDINIRFKTAVEDCNYE